MLRFTVFDIFAVNRQNLGPNFGFEDPPGALPQSGEDTPRTHVYHHAKFHIDSEISVRGQTNTKQV